MLRCFLLTLFALVALSAQEIDTQLLVSGLDSPVDIQNAGDGSGRLFIVEQSGRIRIVRNGQLRNQPFLDIQGRVQGGGERGLLGLAFPPSYAQSGRFYVNYTGAGGHTVVSMFTVSGDPDIANNGSEVVLLTVEQPFSNHNGGQLRFGPDGMLYIGMGDGGSSGDPGDRAQNLNTLLGKMLRVDVESQPGVLNIPASNPFTGVGGSRGEIWAYGLRNPWRFSFDRSTGDLWIADVGQNLLEEVNFGGGAGANYGWNRMEGKLCFQAGCNQSGLVLPVHDYPHSVGCSVTGGHVYRGGQSGSLQGIYIYGDYCSGRIWGLNGQTFANTLLLDTDFLISTFGEDEDGEIYVAHAGGGAIYRITTPDPDPDPDPEPGAKPVFSQASVVNGASFEQGLTPGSLATIFVAGIRDEEGVSKALQIPLPVSLDGVSVSMDGAAAPIHAIARVNGTEQVNVQVPWSLLNDPFASIVVTRDGVSSDQVLTAVKAAQPGVFVAEDQTPAVVHNADFSPVTESNPLQPGEFAAVYLTGLGAVANRPPTGRAATAANATLLQTIEATLGGIPVEVVFAGLAPNFVGVYQVNFVVAGGTPSGLQELVFTLNGQLSPVVRVWVE